MMPGRSKRVSRWAVYLSLPVAELSANGIQLCPAGIQPEQFDRMEGPHPP
jgi:hypothetical protein